MVMMILLFILFSFQVQQTRLGFEHFGLQSRMFELQIEFGDPGSQQWSSLRWRTGKHQRSLGTECSFRQQGVFKQLNAFLLPLVCRKVEIDFTAHAPEDIVTRDTWPQKIRPPVPPRPGPGGSW